MYYLIVVKGTIITNLNFNFPRTFLKAWKSEGLTRNDLDDLKSSIRHYVQNAPDNNLGMQYPGDRLRQTGGAIKLRFTPRSSNQGKSSNYRIIYFIVIENNLYFLTLYPKNKKAALSDKENQEIHKIIKTLRRFDHEQNE